MRQLFAFSISMVARFVGLLAEQFSQWILHRIRDGSEAADLLAELWEFAAGFLQMLAGQLCGRPLREFERYEEQEHGGYYGR